MDAEFELVVDTNIEIDAEVEVKVDIDAEVEVEVEIDAEVEVEVEIDLTGSTNINGEIIGGFRASQTPGPSKAPIDPECQAWVKIEDSQDIPITTADPQQKMKMGLGCGVEVHHHEAHDLQAALVKAGVDCHAFKAGLAGALRHVSHPVICGMAKGNTCCTVCGAISWCIIFGMSFFLWLVIGFWVITGVNCQNKHIKGCWGWSFAAPVGIGIPLGCLAGWIICWMCYCKIAKAEKKKAEIE